MSIGVKPVLFLWRSDKVSNIALIEHFGEEIALTRSELKHIIPGTNDDVENIIEKWINDGLLISVYKDVYYIPRQDRILKNASYSMEKVITKAFLESNGHIFGYPIGINVSNKWGLTSQTACRGRYVSNKVLENMEIKIGKRSFMILAPLVPINNQNAELLQLLDMLLNFKNWSEYSFDAAVNNCFYFIQHLQSIKFPSIEDAKDILTYYPDEIAQQYEFIFKMYGS